MPQNPILAALVAQFKRSITAATVVKAVPGLLCTVIVDVAGSGGALTLNDCATTGAAGSGNQIASMANAVIVTGQPYTFLVPCKTGIVVSAVPTGSTVRVSFT